MLHNHMQTQTQIAIARKILEIWEDSIHHLIDQNVKPEEGAEKFSHDGS